MSLKISAKSVKKTYEIDPIQDGTVTWTTERSGTPGKLEFTVLKNGEINYLEGDLTTFSYKNTDMFYGYVFKKSKQQNEIKTTAYDQLRYLQAKQSYNIKDMNVEGVINKIASDFSLKVGYIEPDCPVLPTKLYESKTLIDIITDCVSRTIIDTGKVLVFFDDFGKLSLRKIEDMQSNYIIGNRSFATDYTYETSIDDSYNHIKLIYPNKASGFDDAYIVRDPEAVSDWGILQYYERVDESLNPAQIQEKARQYLDYYCKRQRTLKLSAYGIPEIRAGSMITIDIPELGDINLRKMLLVDKCTHKISSTGHFMDLEMKVYAG